MSREAWGDEGNVPQHAEDTAAVEEWRSKVAMALARWVLNNSDQMPNEEWRPFITALQNGIDDFDEWLLKALEP